jgi:hypothetical protein
MKTLKLLGLIALSALIIFGTSACDQPEELTDLEGILTITVSSGGPVIGCTLRADYTGEEEITYLWIKDGSPLDYLQNEAGKQQTYSPQSAGGYTVRINHVNDTNNEYPKFAVNPVVIIDQNAPPPGVPTGKTPNDREYYYGTWFMKGSDNGGYLGGWPNITNPIVTDETMVITENSFKVTSTHPGTTTSGGNDQNAQYEYISYDITAWGMEALSTTGFAVTYRLTVKNAKTKGYTVSSNYIYLFFNSDGTLSWGNSKNSVWASGQNPIPGSNPVKYKERVYVRQAN